MTDQAYAPEQKEARRVCGDRAVLRAMHVFDENRRVFQMREAVSSGDFARFLDLVRASGLSSWRLLQNIAPRGSLTQPMALTLAVMEKVLGGEGACRVHGGGFAGTAQAFVGNGSARRPISSGCGTLRQGSTALDKHLRKCRKNRTKML